MKDNKHIKSFNEATENLNISDVMNSDFSLTLTKKDLIKLITQCYSGMNRDILYFVNDEDGITACNKDVSKRPDDLEKEKVFVDRKSAEKFKNTLRNWRDDVRWYIESK